METAVTPEQSAFAQIIKGEMSFWVFLAILGVLKMALEVPESKF